MKYIMKSILLIMVVVILCSFASAVLTDDLELYYPMNESTGTAIYEQMGTLNATAQDISWVLDEFQNPAVRFGYDGDDGTMFTDDTTNLLNFTAYNYTIGFRMNATNASTNGGSMNGNDFLFVRGTTITDNLIKVRGSDEFNKPFMFEASSWERTLNYSVQQVQDEWHTYTFVYTQMGNVSLWVDGVYNDTVYTNCTTVSVCNVDARLWWFANSSTESVGGEMNGFTVWNRSLSAEEVVEWNTSIQNTSNWGGVVTEGNIVTTLNEPTDDAVFSTVNMFFNSTITPSEYNLTNATFYVWHSNKSEFNVTVNTVTGQVANITTLNVSNFTLGNYEWNVLGCGFKNDDAAEDNCSFAVANYSFTIGAAIGNEYYENETYETKYETFQINMTLFTGTTFFDAKLIYNGTNYSVSDIVSLGGDSYSLTRKIDLPLNANYFINDTKSFYWNFVFVDAEEAQTSQTTPTNYQNTSFIVLTLCNTTYATTAVNFTFRDEITGIEINSTSNLTTINTLFNYWLGTGTNSKNYSYSNQTANQSQYQFCLFPAWETIYNNMDMEYEAVHYSPRTYYFRNATLSNITNEIDLNLLTTADSVKFFFEVRQGFTPFAGAVVTISKYFIGEGVYKTIGIRETDDVGEFVEYLDLDKKYKYSVVKNGTSYGTITKVANCEEAPCEITLQLEEAAVDMWQGFYDIFAQNIAYTLIYNDTTKNITFTFNDLTGLAQYFRLEVAEISYNQTGAVVCNETVYTTAGTLICDISVYTSGDFVANAYVSRSPEKVVDYLLIILQAIKDVLGLTGIFVAFMIIVTVGLVGSWNPAVGVALVAFSVFMMRILGFAAFSYTTVVLIFTMAIILIVKMKT